MSERDASFDAKEMVLVPAGRGDHRETQNGFTLSTGARII